MPALPAVNKVIKVTAVQTRSEDVDIINRWFMSYTGTGPSNTDCNTLAATIMTAWVANIIPFQSPDTSIEQIDVVDLTSSTAAEGNNVAHHVGTEAGGALAAGTAAVVSFKVARRYRGGHPRAYIAGITEDKLNDAQTWKGTFITALAAGFESVIATAIASPPASFGALAHVNVSYFDGFTVVTNPITHRARNVPTLRGTPLVDPVGSYVTNPKVASQRRRNLQSR